MSSLDFYRRTVRSLIALFDIDRSRVITPADYEAIGQRVAVARGCEPGSPEYHESIAHWQGLWEAQVRPADANGDGQVTVDEWLDFTQAEGSHTRPEELEKASRILDFMLRPTVEDCLQLWFGKSEQTDRMIWTTFGEDIALASAGHYDHWALDDEQPRLLVALVILLDQFRRNIYRNTPQMYDCDAKCRTLLDRALRLGAGGSLTAEEKIFLCLVLTHSENIEDQRRCLREWEKVEAKLASDSPLLVFREIFNRHLAVVERFGRFPHRNEILGRQNTTEEAEFLADAAFRFDLPLTRRPDGTLAFSGSVCTVKLLDHEYQSFLPKRGTPIAAADLMLQYDDPDQAFAKSQDQLVKQGFVRIGDIVPDFSAESSEGPLSFHEFIGDSWCILFSHPADFTPVCTTEFGVTAKLEDEWKKRNVKVVGLSVDGLSDHAKWIAEINETQGVVVRFPIIADANRRISMMFGMLDPTTFAHGQRLGETMTVRSVFVISPQKRVELILTYPAFIGRNFDEILRLLDALQLSAKYRVATPANWRPGDDTVVLPFVSNQEAEKLFGGKGSVRVVNRYLRYVKDPSRARESGDT